MIHHPWSGSSGALMQLERYPSIAPQMGASQYGSVQGTPTPFVDPAAQRGSFQGPGSLPPHSQQRVSDPNDLLFRSASGGGGSVFLTPSGAAAAAAHPHLLRPGLYPGSGGPAGGAGISMGMHTPAAAAAWAAAAASPHGAPLMPHRHSESGVYYGTPMVAGGAYSAAAAMRQLLDSAPATGPRYNYR